MSKSEWSGWMQAVGAVIAIIGAQQVARLQDKLARSAERKSVIRADTRLLRRLLQRLQNAWKIADQATSAFETVEQAAEFFTPSFDSRVIDDLGQYLRRHSPDAASEDYLLAEYGDAVSAYGELQILLKDRGKDIWPASAVQMASDRSYLAGWRDRIGVAVAAFESTLRRLDSEA